MELAGRYLLNEGHGGPLNQRHTINRSKLDYDQESLTVPLHPLRVKPLGNAYVAPKNIKSSAGYLSLLPDEVIIQLLEFLDAWSLLSFGGTCKALFAFCAFEDLWKALFIGSQRCDFEWQGTWRSTYLKVPQEQVPKVNCEYLFSDVLHRPFFCAHTSLDPYAMDVPTQNIIPKLSNISATDFDLFWTNKPFILTDPVREWPVYRDWSIDILLSQYGDIRFRAEAVDWNLKTYVKYMNDSHDESPLYLFDRAFVEKMHINTGKAERGHYWMPECFGEDLFAVLGEQRPDSRWLVVGPERSGSTFHKDPNATSAWNAVLRGSKYWIMFPSSSAYPPPPGVFVSEDQSEVTSPLSIAEWLLGFHAEARRAPGCMEGICNEGEILHIPSGWWHLVVNLSTSIAITQNFVPRAHLANALDFLKYKSTQISGFKSDVKNPYDTFVEKLQHFHPYLLEHALQGMKKRRDNRKRKWDQLIRSEGKKTKSGEGFSFGFGFGGDEVDDS